MGTDKGFRKNGFTMAVDYFYCLFAGNFYFALMNIPLLGLLFFTATPRSYEASLLEIFLCCLPVGPGLVGLLGTMGKLIRYQDMQAARNFFRTYRNNFLQTLVIWTIQLSLLIILFVDIKSAPAPFRLIYGVLFFVVTMMGFYAFPILSRYHINTRSVLVIATVSIFKQYKTTLTMVMTLIANLLIYRLIPSLWILVMMSSLCLLIMMAQNEFLSKLDQKTQA